MLYSPMHHGDASDSVKYKSKNNLQRVLTRKKRGI